MSADASLTMIAICQLVTTLAGVAAVVGLIYAIVSFKRMISRKIDEVMAKVMPVVDQAKLIAEGARETAQKVGDKVDSIMTKAENTADQLTDRMQRISTKVEEAVSPQVVAAAGIVSGVMKAMQICRDIGKTSASTSFADSDES
jgi:hypothetical protein